MNKHYYLFSLLMAIALSSAGQSLKLTPFYGYTIQDKVYGYYGSLIIGAGPHYGGVLSYQRGNQISIDVTYSHQETTFKVFDNKTNPSNNGNINGSVNYIMIGGTHSPDFSAKVAPYGGLMLGAASIVPKEKFSSETKFAVGGKLGVVVHMSDRVGIMLQTQLMVPVQSVGLGVGCGTGGCGGGAYTSSSATQLGFTGGVEIKLND